MLTSFHNVKLRSIIPFNKNIFYKWFNIAMWHVSIPRSLEDVADLKIPFKMWHVSRSSFLTSDDWDISRVF
jgi:hypothetical protein